MREIKRLLYFRPLGRFNSERNQMGGLVPGMKED